MFSANVIVSLLSAMLATSQTAHAASLRGRNLATGNFYMEGCDEIEDNIYKNKNVAYSFATSNEAVERIIFSAPQFEMGHTNDMHTVFLSPTHFQSKALMTAMFSGNGGIVINEKGTIDELAITANPHCTYNEGDYFRMEKVGSTIVFGKWNPETRDFDLCRRSIDHSSTESKIYGSFQLNQGIAMVDGHTKQMEGAEIFIVGDELPLDFELPDAAKWASASKKWLLEFRDNRWSTDSYNKIKFYTSHDCSGEALDTSGASFFGSSGDFRHNNISHAFDTDDETMWMSLNERISNLELNFLKRWTSNVWNT